ncbi:hypothetical protein BXZ70DRAFT_542852 [Cristinia sonorae]|uniref:Hydrophobin n=1 Tax=Cristinia sonorae TaxID=1940300 RepID=A0A8K0XL80_9AGAR|nr:hypothetical protein BXZ70DRAFT_542852 [Cristinia sonorae]
MAERVFRLHVLARNQKHTTSSRSCLLSHLQNLLVKMIFTVHLLTSFLALLVLASATRTPRGPRKYKLHRFYDPTRHAGGDNVVDRFGRDDVNSAGFEARDLDGDAFNEDNRDLLDLARSEDSDDGGYSSLVCTGVVQCCVSPSGVLYDIHTLEARRALSFNELPLDSPGLIASGCTPINIEDVAACSGKASCCTGLQKGAVATGCALLSVD